MRNLGIHALVWVSDWTESAINQAMAQTAAAGYGLIEAVIFDPAEARPDATARALRDYDLQVVTGMALNPAADISSHDPSIAAAGERLIHDAILATRDMGSKLLGGVTHSAMHRYPTASTPGTLQRVVDTYGRLSEVATRAGVRLGIEAVNRYESNIVNTVDDAAKIVRTIGSDALFAHIDSFHMNIDEHDIAETILRNVDVIGHVHVGESHRGYLGSGSVDFPTFFRALVRAGYDGPIVFEAFSPAVLSADVANALAAWTENWRDSDDLARSALRYMTAQLAAAQSSVSLRSGSKRGEDGKGLAS
jgi:D-psicose/D-tagatose/L-ribulose 3-epimerase